MGEEKPLNHTVLIDIELHLQRYTTTMLCIICGLQLGSCYHNNVFECGIYNKNIIEGFFS